MLDAGAGRNRVAVVSGSYGAGHDAAARELARQLRGHGCEVTTHDIASLLPAGLGHVFKQGYYTQLRLRPSSWETTLGMLEPGRPLHRTAVGLLGLGARRVSQAVSGCDVVIATHPFAGLALGHARERLALTSPAVTYLTDASVHPMWVHRGVDLHLAIHDVAARQARRWGGRTVTVSPLVPPRGRSRPAAGDPLSSLGILGPRALVTGGSLGIGELEQAAHDIAATGVMTPVVACGRNLALAKRLRRGGIVALDWRDDLPEVIEACDCVVQNAGGFTSLEALASGTPVLTYRPIPGHGVANAQSLDEAEWAPWARDPRELHRELVAALSADRRDRIPVDAPTVVEVLTRTDWRTPATAGVPRPGREVRFIEGSVA